MQDHGITRTDIGEAADDKDTRQTHTREDLARLIPALASNGGTQDLQDLQAWCSYHITKWYWCGHSREDCGDIIQAALMENLDARDAHPEYDNNELSKVLIRSLDKHKKRLQRASEGPHDSFDPALHGTGSLEALENQLIARERLDQLPEACETLFELLEAKLLDLSDRDHDLVSRYYGLQDFFPPRLVPAEFFSSADAKRKALYRARRRLADKLEQCLQAMLADCAPRRQSILEAALKLVAEERYRTAARFLKAA